MLKLKPGLILPYRDRNGLATAFVAAVHGDGACTVALLYPDGSWGRCLRAELSEGMLVSALKEFPDASSEPGPEGVPELGDGSRLGEETPLRQQGEAAGESRKKHHKKW